MQLWQENGGTIGGQSAKGHGKLKLYTDWGGFEPQPLISKYMDHIKTSEEKCIKWLEEAFK